MAVGWPKDPQDTPPQEPEQASATARQVGGNHYARFPIQPGVFNQRNNLCWYAANIVKYASRAPFKGQFRQDLEKVIHYAELWLEEGEDS
jgi:hypothetical protein